MESNEGGSSHFMTYESILAVLCIGS